MILFTLFLACTNGPDPKAVLMSSWGENIFIPLYKELEDETAKLYTDSASFCENPSAEELPVLQQQWWAARAPWKKLELLKFGPYKEFPLRLGPKIDFWPVRTDTVNELLAGDTPLEEGAFDMLGASAKGFPVVEYLLYDVANASLENPRFCAYLVGVTYDLSIRSKEMREAWDPEVGNYLSQLTQAGEVEGEYENTEEALAEVVNRLGHTIENIRADNLLTPLGLDIGTVQTEMIGSRFSHRSFVDIEDNLKGIRMVYYGSNDGLGIDDYLQERGHNLDTDFEERYTDIMQTIAIMSDEGNLTESMLIAPESVEYLSENLLRLQALIQGDIVGSMSLWLTFNDADGD